MVRRHDDEAASEVVNQEVSGKEASKKPGKKAGKKKADEFMSSVINESVVETVLEEGYAGQDFLAYEDKYIGLFLKVEDMGGLNVKVAKRDEDKSQIIEAINSGRM